MYSYFITEVEQAFKKKKKIIPLMMESYQPSPWLDGIIGLKTFYDFSGKYEFVTKVKDLLRELETKVRTFLVYFT